MKTPQQNIAETLQGKKVLFIENDNGLYNGLDQIEILLKENGIEYSCLFEVGEKSFDDIKKEIAKADAIIFQTQWVYEISKQIHTYMTALKDKKIVIECYAGTDPTWYHKPKVVHDVYIASCPEDHYMEWRFYKLHKTKSYWDFKNKFDK